MLLSIWGWLALALGDIDSSTPRYAQAIGNYLQQEGSKRTIIVCQNLCYFV